MKSRYMLITCLLILWMPQAYGQAVLKEKKISGRFPAAKGRLVIDNRYGKLDINTWDRAEVTVDIIITAKAKSASSAQDLLDKVRITEPANNDKGIYYKTEIGPRTSGSTRGELSIDYVINIPRRHEAVFVNRYGDIDLEDAEGKPEIDLKYGNLKTGAITGTDKSIKVGFGSASIPSIETGTITVSYSRLSIGKAGSITVSNQYEQTIIGTVRSLDVSQKYGDLKIGSVHQLKGNVQFGGLSVDKLLKSVHMNSRYGTGAAFDYIGPDVDDILVTSSYSNQSYHFDKAASLSGEIALSYGRVNDGAGTLTLTKSGSDIAGSNARYTIRTGSGRGNISLTASYGNVVFR